MKKLVGAVFTFFGTLGLLLEAAKALPPEFHVGPFDSIVTVIGILLLGLGYQDELEGGKKALLDLVKAFLAKPFVGTVFSVVVFALNAFLDNASLPENVGMILTALSVLLGVLGIRDVHQAVKLHKLERRLL